MDGERIPGNRVVGRTKHGPITVDELAGVAPGMADLMETFARRYWTLYYAAKGVNWELARYEWLEGRKLLEASTTTRPKYAEDVRAFLAGPYAELGAALDQEAWSAVEGSYHAAVRESDRYHEKYAKPFIRFRLPSRPPDGLDLGPG